MREMTVQKLRALLKKVPQRLIVRHYPFDHDPNELLEAKGELEYPGESICDAIEVENKRYGKFVAICGG